MVFAFDSLSFAKHLRDHGVPQDQAEAHAEAARQFIMAELVTRNDLDSSISAARDDLDSSIAAVRHDLEVLRRELENKMDTLSLRLTVRMGTLIAVDVAVLAAIIKL